MACPICDYTMESICDNWWWCPTCGTVKAKHFDQIQMPRMFRDNAKQQQVAHMPDTIDKTIATECWRCIHKRSIPGDAHIRCAKPDPFMTGHPHGISNGWFLYPFNFDPTWKTARCNHFSQDIEGHDDE